MRYKAAHSVNLQIPRERAWDKLKDLSLAPRYVPGVSGMEFITRKREGVGAARIVFPQMLREEVVEWEPGKGMLLKLSKHGRDGFFPFRNSVFRYTLSETGMTFMNLSLEYEPVLGKLGHILFGGIIRSRIVRTAEKLKSFYENQ